MPEYTGLFEKIAGVLTTSTSFSRCNPMWFLSMELRQGSGLCSSSSRKYPGAEGTNQNRHWNHHRRHATNSLERTRLSCWRLWNYKGRMYRAPVRYVTKTWSVVLLNKKMHILLSQVYCVWQVVKTPTIISNNPVFYKTFDKVFLVAYKCALRNGHKHSLLNSQHFSHTKICSMRDTRLQSKSFSRCMADKMTTRGLFALLNSTHYFPMLRGCGRRGPTEDKLCRSERVLRTCELSIFFLQLKSTHVHCESDYK